MRSEYRVKRDACNEPMVDQGLVHGLPVTYNPDDHQFYVHAAGTNDGTSVLGRFTEWRNAVQHARRHSAKSGGSAGKGA